MSDEFDKEAEREKLREKFAEDDKKREHTQRMSELLLKGATMTNRHCERCGDPIFRHDGREFCPTCNRPTDEDNGSDADAQEASGSRSTATTPGEANATDTEVDASTPNVSTSSGRIPDMSASTHAADPSAEQTDRDDVVAGGHIDEASGFEPDAVDDVADARVSLTRTLTKFARAAERADDPRRAREHLQVAREAAETLSALDR